jgi:FKBP-type peptidyl-prolyl cis-trans isomerase
MTSRFFASLFVCTAFAVACNQDDPADATTTAEKTAAKTADKKAPKADKKTAKPEAPVDFTAPSDVAAAPADASRTASGLAYKVLVPGTGTDHPGPRDVTEVHYTGWTTDGEMFDSSYKRNQPASFALDKVIAGWTEGLQFMVVGEKTRFWIPESLAYKGRPGAPAGMLVFDVELLSLKKAPEPPQVPADVAAPPADAKKTTSGLAYKVIKAGTGTKHPSATSKVKVHYSGWTTDGEMFDSSVTRGQPATFPLNRVIAGWTEGLQLMVEGEKTRLWIPVELAYKNQPGRPAGMLVFDVEMLQLMD